MIVIVAVLCSVVGESFFSWGFISLKMVARTGRAGGPSEWCFLTTRCRMVSRGLDFQPHSDRVRCEGAREEAPSSGLQGVPQQVKLSDQDHP